MPKGRPDKGYALTPQREAVLKILAAAGGSLDDEAGLVVSQLKQRTGHESTQALSMVIKQLEQSGLVRRDVAGRRTYHLELVEDAIAPEDRARLGLRTNGAAPAPVEDTVTIDEPEAPADSTDYRKLADELLKRASEVLSRGAGDPRLRLRIVDLESKLDAEKEQTADLSRRLKERGFEVLDLKEQLRIAQHNLDVERQRHEKQRAERGSDPVGKRLTDRERRELEALKRALAP